MNSWLKQHGAEWIYRAIVVAGLAALAWLNSNYVTRAEFDQTRVTIAGIERTLAIMVEQNKVNDRQDTALQDHEVRLRTLERSGR